MNKKGQVEGLALSAVLGQIGDAIKQMISLFAALPPWLQYAVIFGVLLVGQPILKPIFDAFFFAIGWGVNYEELVILYAVMGGLIVALTLRHPNLITGARK